MAAFSEKGFHGTTTRDIAGAAGMSPAAVYVHHKSKEELLHVISRDGHQAALDVVREARAATDEPCRAARRGRPRVRDVPRGAPHRGAGSSTTSWQRSARSTAPRSTSCAPASTASCRELVAAGVAAGAFDAPDPALAATALASMGIDIARWYREDGEWSPDQIGDYYADLALRLAGAAGRGPQTSS